jgi:hypothetical protein
VERLETTVEADGRLLKVDHLGEVTAGIARGYLLTFDVGRLLLEVATGKVHSVVIENKEEISSDARDASEAEPWWRVIGCPITKVWAGEIGAQGLRVQFRGDHENPRVISFVPDGADVRVSLEPTGNQ